MSSHSTMSKQPVSSSSAHQPKKPATSGNVVGLFWDFENCSLPRGINAFDVVKHIRDVLVVGTKEREVCFCAVGDTGKLPVVHQQGLANANVKMQHVPGGKVGAADRALWLELDRFVHSYPAPASIVVITGDIDFVQKINLLRHTQGYRVTVIHNQVAKRELKETANSVYEWTTFTRSQQKEGAPSQKSSSSTPASTSDHAAHIVGNTYPNPFHPHPLRLQAAAVPDWLCDCCLKPLTKGPTYVCSQKGCEHFIHRTCFSVRPKPMPNANQSQNASNSSSKPRSSKPKAPKSQSSKSVATKLVCMCESEFSTYQALAQHQQAKSHWSCPFCDRKPFGSEEAVHSHMLQKHSDQCEAESSSSASDDSDEEDCHCPVCDDYFGSETALLQHREAKQHWFVCNTCRDEFTTKQGCEAHQRDKHGSNSVNNARTVSHTHFFSGGVNQNSQFTTTSSAVSSPFGGSHFNRIIQEAAMQQLAMNLQPQVFVPSIQNGELQLGEPLHKVSPQDVEIARARENRVKAEHNTLLSHDAASSTPGGKALLFACPQCSCLCEGTGSLQRHYNHMHANFVEARGLAFSKWHQQQLSQTADLVVKRIQSEADRQLAAALGGQSVKREVIPFNATMPPPEIRGVEFMKYVLWCTISGCSHPRSLGSTGYAEHYSIFHAPDAPEKHKVVSENRR